MKLMKKLSQAQMKMEGIEKFGKRKRVDPTCWLSWSY
jgi:hypothetical protein